MPKSTRKGTHAAGAACEHYLAGKKIYQQIWKMSFWASQAGNFKNLRMRRKTTSLTVLPIDEQRILQECEQN